MWGSFSKSASDAKAQAKKGVSSAVTRSKLADLKVAKAQRDFQISMQMAKGRDQLHYMIGFYALLLGVNAARCYRLKRFEPLPISELPFVAGPIFFAFNIDASYGNKLNRVNREAAMIRGVETHWFNEPMNLPKSLEQEYRAMMKEQNARIRSVGAKEEADWATFDDTPIEELLDGSTPLSRTLHNLGVFAEK